MTGSNGRPHEADKPLISLKQVSKTYHSAAGDFPALKDLDAAFYPGEFVSVVGKSGSGKSTLVNMITGIDHPSSGQVVVDGVDIHRLSESQRASWRGLNLGIIFQFFQLLPNLTLLENVMLPMDFCHKYPRHERPERARALLAQVGLADSEEALPAAVSGGEQQRTAIARALANDPPIVLADEPTGNLDTTTAATVHGIFEGLVQQGKTIIMVTHDPELAGKTQRQLLLSDGELINPVIANWLGFLPHRRLLWLTHRMNELVLPADTSIERAIDEPLGLLLVVDGTLESRDPMPPENLSRLTAGTLISQFELKGATSDIANLKSGRQKPTRILWLTKADFERWMGEEPHHRDHFDRHRDVTRVGELSAVQGHPS